MASEPVLLDRNAPTEEFPWGAIRWMSGSAFDASAEMTFGEVWIEPGESNPVHSHPNCEEILYIVSGSCEHSVDGDWAAMEQGDAIRVPRGVPHNAINKGDEPVHMIVCYSSPDRQMQKHG